MFKITPSQKQIDKYLTSDDTYLKTPDTWVNFARMCKIRSAGNIVNFNPYQYQIDLVNLMLARSVCVVKSRQLGISETIINFMLWRACLNPGYLGLVFSKTQTDSSLLARRMKRMIESLGLKTTTENLGDIEIKGRGRVLFRNSKPDSARGIESVVDVFLDELGFLETGKEVYDALAPAMQMVGDKARVFAVSTPNGKAGFFWDLINSGNGSKDIESICNRISKGEYKPFETWVDNGGWGKVLIHWKTHPIYGQNLNFLKDIHEKQKLTLATIEQEYNLNFQESEVNYFSADIIRKCAVGSEEDVVEDSFYFIGIDTSTVGEDYSVAAVLKFENEIFSLVDVYRKRRETSEYHLFKMGDLISKYNPVAVGIEITGGTGVIYHESLCKSYPLIQFHQVRTTGDSKPAMLNRLKLLLEQEKFIYPNNSKIIDELLNFQRRDDGKLGAAQGKHDDIIMSSVFALTAAVKEEFL
ncbi:MAG: hypothetical protein AAFS12_00240 [Cyanobacteria bacterium J06632_19]